MSRIVLLSCVRFKLSWLKYLLLVVFVLLLFLLHLQYPYAHLRAFYHMVWNESTVSSTHVVTFLHGDLLVVEGQGRTPSQFSPYVEHVDLKMGVKGGRRIFEDSEMEEGPENNTVATIYVAIGLGITSAGQMEMLTEDNLDRMLPIFTTLLPSFCQTHDSRFRYGFYLGYDYNDELFTTPKLVQAFHATFQRCVRSLCHHTQPSALGTITLHLVECNYTGSPAWAQNDAMMEAYLDGADYFYRVNDDSCFLTDGWTTRFISTLRNFRPPNVGVVGPTHYGGNEDILTYDFVHRSHIDIFGFYYPRVFKDWYADEWITFVYDPTRSVKLDRVRLDHLTSLLGRRYNYSEELKFKLSEQIMIDQVTIDRYIESRGSRTIFANNSRVISMSLAGRNPRLVEIAIRNAQLASVFYPTWLLRFYVPILRSFSNISSAHEPVPQRILRTLRILGVQLVFVDAPLLARFSPQCWHYLAIDDGTVVEVFLPNAESVFDEFTSSLVNRWLTNPSHELICSRNNPETYTWGLNQCSWGTHVSFLNSILKKSFFKFVSDFTNAPQTNSTALKRGERMFRKSVWSIASNMSQILIV